MADKETPVSDEPECVFSRLKYRCERCGNTFVAYVVDGKPSDCPVCAAICMARSESEIPGAKFACEATLDSDMAANTLKETPVSDGKSRVRQVGEAMLQGARDFGVHPKPTPSGVEIMPPEVLISGDAVGVLSNVCHLADTHLRNSPQLASQFTDVRTFIDTIIEGT